MPLHPAKGWTYTNGNSLHFCVIIIYLFRSMSSFSETPTLQHESSSLESTFHGPFLVISDLHGNLQLLVKALEEGVRRAGKADLTVILLGDYVDNGPDVPGLLEYLSTEKWRSSYPSMSIHAILGNHDLACLLALNPAEFNGDPNWTRRGKDRWMRWVKGFHLRGGETHLQYGARTQAQFRSKFPSHHREWLRGLPWYLRLGGYLFVHAGIRDPSVEPLEEQLRYLDSKSLHDVDCRHPHPNTYGGGGYGMPDHLTNKFWVNKSYPEAGVVVVTGHNKLSDEEATECVDHLSSHRVGFHSCACEILINPSLSLHCAIMARLDTACVSPRDGDCGEGRDIGAQTEANAITVPPLFFGVTY